MDNLHTNGETGIDPTIFRSGMRLLSAGVTIVATVCRGQRWGLTATAVCSLSAAPPRVLACVNVNGSTFQYITESRSMTVNVLAQRQEEIARRFAGLTSTDQTDPFALGHWRPGKSGAPVLGGALVVFDCIVNEMFIAHSHAIMVGEVQDVSIGEPNAPLVYMNGTFTTVAGLPEFRGTPQS